MVKRQRITKAPVKQDLPASADSWTEKGGVDPEIQPTIAPQSLERRSPKPQGKPYPHRVSFDMTTEQYKRLKRASFEEECSLNEILREATEAWLRARNY